MMEMGILDIELEIYKRKIKFYRELILNKRGEKINYNKYLVDAFDVNEEWKKNVRNIMKIMKIDDVDLEMSKDYLNKKLRISAIDLMKKSIDKDAREKGVDGGGGKIRIKYYKENIEKFGEIKYGADYMEYVNRDGMKNMIEGRCRLFPCKENFRYLNKSITCRWCKRSDCPESEKHILERCKECPIVEKFISEDFFSNDKMKIKNICKSMKIYYEELRKRGERW